MTAQPAFFGPWIVRAAFTMALCGWGLGFYGPPIFLHSVVQRTGWPLALGSVAVTLHFLFGALVVTQLPALHRRFGVGPVAVAGAMVATLGILGWSVAAAPWQLMGAALLSGAGWVTMGAVAVNAAIAPWYVRDRPVALAKAYNGASIGGVVFSPLWVWLIGRWGLTTAALLVGTATVAVMAGLSHRVLSRSPGQLGQQADGAAAAPGPVDAALEPAARPLRLLWRQRSFVTLALGMAAGLSAQIGLLAHLYGLLVPALGAQQSGWALGMATACAIVGRMAAAAVVVRGADRRAVAAAAYALQLGATLLLAVVDRQQTAWIVAGVALFGSGIGNATSLPPLIAQAEFHRAEVARVVAQIVAFAQACYAFAPACMGLVLAATLVPGGGIGAGSAPFFAVVAAVQALAMTCLLLGRRGASAR